MGIHFEFKVMEGNKPFDIPEYLIKPLCTFKGVQFVSCEKNTFQIDTLTQDEHLADYRAREIDRAIFWMGDYTVTHKRL